ncbi:phosphoribosylaminoimidazolesuccinocarboxamide synthase [Nostoc sp.]|uniref:phosphoribosylaminoimidazolesuccinocarboxamide synthase n=1 Tax=Nostoc sp. TaxID=1180 RepID=UPI002FF9DF33
MKYLCSGKVRDIYELDNSCLVFITTDRISAYDHILPNNILGKGKVLTQMSIFWMEFLSDIVPNHFISANEADIRKIPLNIGTPDYLKDRTMLVQKANMFDIECIVRGYLAGSAWREYNTTGKVTGLNLPLGLKFADKLPQPVFTPSTKSNKGNDINITFEQARSIVGDDIEELSRISLALYSKASKYADDRGIILADTKFEFGRVDNRITLVDEVLTPDSSRYWNKFSWKPGENPFGFDKQIIRDWLDANHWNHKPPPPNLPNKIIEETHSRYSEIYGIIMNARK